MIDKADSFALYDGIAIISMTVRFPGAENVDEFWRNLKDGVESISFFSDQELLSSGIDLAVLRGPSYVKAGTVLKDVELFDASFFGFNPREAEITDPQHRLFLECAWEALESAGYNPEKYTGSIGVYAGAWRNTYLYIDSFRRDAMSLLQAAIGNEKDYLTSRVSYKLNLKGPSVCVQSACSTSLVAVHLACQGLLNGECDMALAGGVTIGVPQKAGYFCQEGLTSPDGHCRAFDARAQGTVFGNGAGIVVLKRLADALADGDRIQAVVKGSAVNNDGSLKVGYTAPSVEGQARVIVEALAVSGIDAETVTYVETHGTGTPLGDPIEIAALTQAFRASTEKNGFCAIGSVKTNIGHLNTAAGIAGLIKTVLALKHKLLPPSLHFEQPNPKIDFVNSPFYVNTSLSEWKAGETPRRAGVSSFGIGGTNAHVILEEAPITKASGESRPWQLLVLSAQTSSALETATSNLVKHLKQHPDLNLADVAHTLQVGRRAFSCRRMLVCQNRDEALNALEACNPKRVFTSIKEPRDRPVTFMFPGQGAQYVNMALELYQVEPTFREQIDVCSAVLIPHLGLDLREVLYHDREQAEEAKQQLKQTWITQPTLFVIEYALAKLWMEWGIHPQAMIGHSIGEYVAACLAGVLSLDDALALVAARGRLMQQLPGGAMLAIPLPEQEVHPMLGKKLSLAATNSPSQCVISGPPDAVAQLEHQLTGQGVSYLQVHTSHAFHSEMMEPILEPFTAQVKAVNLKPPQVPYVSNVTGTWITAAEATSPSYWARHLRQKVRFAEGLRELLKDPDRILLEVGPGQTLTTFTRQHPDKALGQVVLSSLRHPHDRQSDLAFLLNTLGQLWLAGIKVDWSGFYAHERRHHIPLPTYPFERQRYWVEPQKQTYNISTHEESIRKKPDIADWFYIPSWKQSMSPIPFELGDLAGQKRCWLVFSDECGLGSRVVKRLKQERQDVITVKAGEEFGRVSDSVYRLNPQQRNDYDSLFKELRVLDKTPNMIVHLWSVIPDDHKQSGIEFLEKCQYLGFYSLLFLAQALGEQKLTAPLQIEIISNNMQAVTGEEVLCPEKATMLGPCKVIPQEYPNIVCRSIDIVTPESGSQQEAKLIDQLIAEFTTKPSELCVAYRGKHRWVQTFEPVCLDSKNGRPTRLRQGGVYLITGGLGGIGLVLAEYLAQTVQAKLTLIGRSAFPERDEWEKWLATHDYQDDISRKIRKVQTLEELGAEVLVFSADVANQEHMQSVITQIYERFGTIHGVIHAAGIVSGGMIQLRTPEKVAGVFAPKVKGTLVLEAVLKNVILDFLVLCSSTYSVTSGFGQVDYCAANAFLDAFAHYHTSRCGLFTVSINWDGWQEVGMAVDAIRSYGLKGIQQTSHSSYREIPHPLLDKCIFETLDQETYAAELCIAKQWVLDEYRIMENAVMPGTAYLEMARAASEGRLKNGTIEIREAVFVAPLMVMEDEEKEVRTVVKKDGDDFDFFIISRSASDKGERPEWKEHARGKIAYIDSEPPKKYEIKNIEKECSEMEAIVSEQEQGNKKRSIHSSHITLGLRWKSLKWVKFGTNQGLALLELPEAFSADLETFKLHPALLDVATGFMMLSVDDGVYLPFSYKLLRIKKSLPARIYSYARCQENKHLPKGTRAFDIIITNDQGEELVEIEEYTLKKIDDVTLFSPEAIQQRSQKASPVPANQNFCLGISSPGILNTLTLRATTRREPGPGEVEIEVVATGLNFKDVLSALGMFPGPLGHECTGRVVALGEGVEGFQMGDEVIAMASSCFSAFTTTSASFVVAKPTHLSFEEAATIPIVFLTAYYALHDLGRFCKGERVLIHAAAGGVGLAAVQLAQQAGAEIFATAGSAEKRAFLQSLGVEHVMDSRSLAFADEVMERTGGKGVDVVLNSLAGEFIPKTLAILGSYGRFLEIGKWDISQNSQLDLRPFQKNLAFFAIDLGLMLQERPDFVKSLLRELMQYFKNGILRPLPHRVFPITEVASAFDYMARAKHIGKIVVSLKDQEVLTVLSSEVPITRRSDSTYSITGHLGGLGLHKKFVEDNLLDLREGILSREGVDVFSRILSSRSTLPQVVVSTRDLQALIEKANAFAQSRILEEREWFQLPHQAHPRSTEAFMAPRTLLESLIAKIWQDVLGVDRVSVYDNFLDLGGHSLLAIQVISRLRGTLQVELPMPMLFEAPTIAELAEAIEKTKDSSAELRAPAISPISREAHRVKVSSQGVPAIPKNLAKEV